MPSATFCSSRRRRSRRLNAHSGRNPNSGPAARRSTDLDYSDIFLETLSFENVNNHFTGKNHSALTANPITLLLTGVVAGGAIIWKTWSDTQADLERGYEDTRGKGSNRPGHRGQRALGRERNDGRYQVEREPVRAHQSSVESRNADELDE
jgi:hypothetical protein